MKLFRGICLLLCLVCFLASCGGSEPEQIYLVSAVGFDGDADGYTLTLEIPAGSTGAGGGERLLLEGRGSDVEQALRAITLGLSRELSFSHCALMVLGEGLTTLQSDAIFEFASSGVLLPLAAQVIQTPNARELLSSGNTPSPAAGYEIPSILREAEGIFGFETRSRIYELRANAKPNRPTVLPYFLPSDKQTAVFGGLSVLQREKPAVRVDAASCTAYAILSDLFRETDGAPASFGEGRIQRIESHLTAEPFGDGLSFSLEVVLRAETCTDQDSAIALREEVERGTEALFSSLCAQANGDTVFFFDRAEGLEGMQEAEYALRFAKAQLSVHCRVIGGEEMK